MHGYMDGWVIEEGMDTWMDFQMNELAWTHGWMNWQSEGVVEGQIDGGVWKGG